MFKYSWQLLAGSAVAAAVAVAISPARAEAPMGFVGTIGGNYATNDYSGGGNTDAWGINGAGAFGFGMNDIGGEVTANYRKITDSGSDADVWGFGGSVFWAPGYGRFGPSVTYSKLDLGSGIDAKFTTYGGFAEFFIGDVFTLAVKGGGITADFHFTGLGSASEDGSYIGGEFTGYIMPNLSLKANLDYSSLDAFKSTGLGITAEYQFSQDTPVTVYGGFTRTQLDSGLGQFNTWTIGLKFYTNGPAPLRTLQRTGTLGNVSTVQGLQFGL